MLPHRKRINYEKASFVVCSLKFIGAVTRVGPDTSRVLGGAGPAVGR